MTQENEKYRRSVERGVSKIGFLFIVVPHVQKVIAVDKRIFDDSKTLVKTFSFSELVERETVERYWSSIVNNGDLGESETKQLVSAAVDVINNERSDVPRSYSEPGVVNGSIFLLIRKPWWQFMREYLGRFVDLNELDEQIMQVAMEEERMYNRNLILGIRSAGVQTIWAKNWQ